MKKLVIVESPAKARTIEKYLGRDFSVRATMGHLRDLPKNELGVDVGSGFLVNYKPIDGKEKIIDELRGAVKSCERVYLATDPDREGEAISWHLSELLKLPEEKTMRVTFPEITKNVVLRAIENPRAIDMSLVDAQQARRVLDRLVGYQISPLLWRCIKRGLSAGRVQSVATRLIVDREKEIAAFIAEEYWTLEAYLCAGQGSLVARYHGPENAKKTELGNKEQCDAIIAAVTGAGGRFSVARVAHQEKKRSPAPPFTTSTLQQEASRKLSMNARRTMSVAQELYEGVNMGQEGQTGLITYMRTDSLRLSDEALSAARELIKARYGAACLPSKPRVYKSKSNAQDAHEAIRPTYADLTPEQAREHLSNDQYRLYKLIWERFIACQMENAVLDTLTVDSVCAGHVFRSTYTSVVFQGFMSVYVEGRDDEEDEQGNALPGLKEGEELGLEKLDPKQHFTQPPARFTEASLIKALEEKGIGRPSTYAPTVSTIVEREYVKFEGKSLRPTPLGEVVNGVMVDRFNDIVDVDFTARMENKLDEVGEGRQDWRKMLGEFYTGFESNITKAEKELTGVRLRVPDEPSEVPCDLCGRMMVYKSGRFGRFLACPGYPECKNTKPIVEETPGACPLCGGTILKKKSRNGYSYYGCKAYPDCGFMTWDVPQKENCPDCGKTLFKKSGRGPKKAFCINAECRSFVPEDKRGYPKREEGEAKNTTKKTPKKTAPKKTAVKSKAKGKKS